MNYEMKLRPEYFEKIKNGQKIYEIRLNDEKRKKIKIGDFIKFLKEPKQQEKLNVKVQDLLIFDSFEQMAENLPLDLVGFENKQKNEVIDIYHEFYSEEKEKKYKVLAIKIFPIISTQLRNQIDDYISKNCNFENIKSINKKDKKSLKLQKTKLLCRKEMGSIDLINETNFSDNDVYSSNSKNTKLNFQNKTQSLNSANESNKNTRFCKAKYAKQIDEVVIEKNKKFDSLYSDDCFDYLSKEANPQNENKIDKKTYSNYSLPTYLSKNITQFGGIELKETFNDKLFNFIDKKNISDIECYKNANIDRRLFSKIRSNKYYQPSKKTVFAFAIALKLNLIETKELLESAGFTLSHSFIFDVIIEFFIKKNNYDIFQINEILDEYQQEILGSK